MTPTVAENLDIGIVVESRVLNGHRCKMEFHHFSCESPGRMLATLDTVATSQEIKLQTPSRKY